MLWEDSKGCDVPPQDTDVQKVSIWDVCPTTTYKVCVIKKKTIFLLHFKILKTCNMFFLLQAYECSTHIEHY